MRRLVSVMAVALVLAACGGSSTGDRRVTTFGDEVVVRVVTRGGFAAEASQRQQPPQLTVFLDGRVIIVGPTTQEFPGPALPNLQEFRLIRRGVRGILGEARATGLFADQLPDYGDPGITDQPTTTVTVRAVDTTRSVDVYALGFTAGLTKDQRENRRRLERFVELTGDPEALHDLVVPDSTQRYRPSALAVIIRPSDTTEGETRPWPVGDLASMGAPSGRFPGARCAVLSGSDLTSVLYVASAARAFDRWESGGAPYDVQFYPLLPDQRGCEDLE
jgi:hypothetical protein